MAFARCSQEFALNTNRYQSSGLFWKREELPAGTSLQVKVAEGGVGSTPQCQKNTMTQG